MNPTWLLLCATKPEWREFKKEFMFERINPPNQPLWQLFTQKSHQTSKNIFLGQLGISPHVAEESFEKICKALPTKPDFVLHFGLSGALIESLKIGDIIIAQEFHTSNKDPIKLNKEVKNKIEKLMQKSLLNITFGPLLTSSKVLKTPDEKSKAYHWPFKQELIQTKLLIV